MSSQRNTPHRNRSRPNGSAGAGCISAQIIGLQAYRPQPNAPRTDARKRRAQTAQSSEFQQLLVVLKSEVAIAAGISRGLGETLVQLQDQIAAIGDDIAPNEALRLQGVLLKQIAHLRATVIAASDDLRNVVPSGLAQILDAARSSNSDIVYS